MKVAKTYKEFSKIKRKFYKRNAVKRIDHFNGKRFVSYWEEKDWLCYVVNSFDEYISENISKYVKDVIGNDLYDNILENVKYLYDNKDKVFHFRHSYNGNVNEIHGSFCHVILTNRDAYFAINSKKDFEYILIPMFWKIEKEN